MTEIRIETITPVFIGKGEEVTPFDYVLTEDRFAVFDLPKYFQENDEKIEDFYRKVNKNPGEFNLSDFLGKDRHLEEFWKYSVKSSGVINDILSKSIKERKPEMSVKSHIKDELTSHPYIPGSSLKGAIRTAFLYNILRKDRDRIKTLLESWLDEAKRGSFEDKKRLEGKLKYALFLSEPFTGKCDRANDAQKDLFRFLTVADSPADEDCLELNLIDTYSMYNYKGYKSVYETIMKNTVMEGNININKNLFCDKFRGIISWTHSSMMDIKRLFQMINFFTLDILDREIWFFENLKGNYPVRVKKFYETFIDEVGDTKDNTAYLSVGQGSGWHKMTVGLILKDILSEDDFTVMREVMGLARHRLNFSEYPKSRKLIMKKPGEDLQPAGWIKLSLLSGKKEEIRPAKVKEDKIYIKQERKEKIQKSKEPDVSKKSKKHTQASASELEGLEKLFGRKK